jgi:hypothetical protein
MSVVYLNKYTLVSLVIMPVVLVVTTLCSVAQELVCSITMLVVYFASFGDMKLQLRVIKYTLVSALARLYIVVTLVVLYYALISFELPHTLLKVYSVNIVSRH